MSAGAITMSPTASPSHQVSHTRGASCHERSPPSARDTMPMVAETMVLTSAASTVKRMMSRTRSKTRPPRANRLTRYAPSSPSAVLPIAMPREGSTAPVVVKFARNAAPRIAGQTVAEQDESGEGDAGRRPDRRHAAVDVREPQPELGRQIVDETQCKQ